MHTAETAAPMDNAAGPARVTERFCQGLFARASPEFRLLTACCRWPLEESRPRIVRLLAATPIDFPRLLRLAERHRVTGLLAAALAGQPSVPGEIAARLGRRTAGMQAENLAHIALAVRAARALEANGIPMLVLKGAPLSRLAFGTAGSGGPARHMRDIDLLVAPADVPETERLLLSLGFERRNEYIPRNPRQVELWQRFRKHQEFAHRQTGITLELHWRAFDNAELGEISLSEAQWVEVSPGQRLPTLPTPELLLLLCVHGAGHAWFRLKWIADVAALVGSVPGDGWAELLDDARARDLDRPVEQALLLCAALFGTPAPAALAESTATGRWLAGIARDALLTEVAQGKSAEADFVPRRLTASRLLLRRSWRYRLEEARVHAASPADWQALPVPRPLQFLYPLLRLPLWARRRWFPRHRK